MNSVNHNISTLGSISCFRFICDLHSIFPIF